MQKRRPRAIQEKTKTTTKRNCTKQQPLTPPLHFNFTIKHFIHIQNTLFDECSFVLHHFALAKLYVVFSIEKSPVHNMYGVWVLLRLLCVAWCPILYLHTTCIIPSAPSSRIEYPLYKYKIHKHIAFEHIKRRVRFILMQVRYSIRRFIDISEFSHFNTSLRVNDSNK